MHIGKVTQNRIPVQNSWCFFTIFQPHSGILGFSDIKTKGEQWGEYGSFEGVTHLFFSLKGVLGFFRKSQRYQTFFLETAGEKVLRGWIQPPR